MKLRGLSTLLLLSACAQEVVAPPAPPPEEPAPDAGPTIVVLDAGPVDAGPTDAGPPPIPCGAGFCAADQVCLAFQCVDHDDCRARPAGADLFGDALSAIDLDRCTAEFPADPYGPFPALMKNDPFRLPFFNRTHDKPLRAPGWAERLVARLGHPARPHAVSEMIVDAASELGVAVERRPNLGHALDTGSPLAVAMNQIISERGSSPDAAAISADAQDVPIALQRKVALLLYAVAGAADERDRAFGLVTGSLGDIYALGPAFVAQRADSRAYDPGNNTFRAMVLDRVRWGVLYQAAHDLARAVEDSGLEAHAGAVGVSFDQPTPLGRVIVADAAAQVFEGTLGHVALLVDTGGNDVYRIAAGASSSATLPISVVVDLGGDDSYGYPEVSAAGDAGRLPSDVDGRFTQGDITQGQTAMSRSDRPRQGAGRAGIGMLFDRAGDDRYRSLRMSQGFGAFGVGVLADDAGNDRYDAEAAAQGSAAFGIGILLDRDGDDTRRLYTHGQGFGFTRGFGALVDGEGSDLYFADPGTPSEGGDPLYYSPQLPGSGNTSMAQGAGFGRRDDSGRGAMSGGIGVLADLGGGADHYVASVFGQGTGYWFGTGVLHDEGGDDLYEGKWYVRGSAAHFALALFRDKAGNDRHNTGTVRPTLTSMGQGHDFSVGWLVDDAGNDIYDAPGLALGGGNANGWGFLVDLGGDDEYRAPRDRSMGGFGEAGGQAGDTFRPTRITLGLLLDRGGTDTYTLSGTVEARQNTITEAATDPLGPLGKGVHLDAAAGEVLILP